MTDTGCGIPAADLPRVTEAFYMVDKSRSRAAGGSGIGLALCARIAGAHGAKLEITSTEGVGTTVTVSVPILSPDDLPAARMADGQGAAMKTNTLRLSTGAVLLVVLVQPGAAFRCVFAVGQAHFCPRPHSQHGRRGPVGSRSPRQFHCLHAVRLPSHVTERPAGLATAAAKTPGRRPPSMDASALDRARSAAARPSRCRAADATSSYAAALARSARLDDEATAWDAAHRAPAA